MRASLLACLLVGLLSSCSHDHEHDPYDTYQACFDAHFEDEMLSITQSIVVCCLDHPIAGMEQPVCGETEPACINYLTANLSETDADIAAKMTACTEYVAQKSM